MLRVGVGMGPVIGQPGPGYFVEGGICVNTSCSICLNVSPTYIQNADRTRKHLSPIYSFHARACQGLPRRHLRASKGCPPCRRADGSKSIESIQNLNSYLARREYECPRPRRIGLFVPLRRACVCRRNLRDIGATRSRPVRRLGRLRSKSMDIVYRP